MVGLENEANFQHFDLNEIAVYLDGQQVQCHGEGEQAPAVSDAGGVWSDRQCLKIATIQRDVTLERFQQRGAADEWRPSIVWCLPARDRRGAWPRGDLPLSSGLSDSV